MKSILSLLAATVLTAAGFQAAAQAWPNDPEAFDYGVEAGATKVADLSAATFQALGISKESSLTVPAVTVDGITWMSGEKNTGKYRPGRVIYNRVKSYELIPGTNTKVPSDVGIRFKINRPGTFKMYRSLAFQSLVWEGNEQKFIAVLATTKGGVTTAKTIYSVTPEASQISTSSSKANQSNDELCVVFEITEDMLKGIDGPATIYLWHRKDNDKGGLMLAYFSPRWTPAL